MRKITHLKYPWNGGWVGMMLIQGEKNVLLDTALKEAVPSFLKDSLSTAGISFLDLDYVINTHHHEDHAGGNAALKVECVGGTIIGGLSRAAAQG